MEKKDQSVDIMWEKYLSSINESIDETEKTYSAWNFCNDEKSANELAKLVKENIKTATSSLNYWYTVETEPLPQIGDYSIILNWNGVAECVIQTISVNIMAYNEVSEAFARKEGEGDRSLAYWKRVHKEFFSEELKALELEFKEDMLVVCEEFVRVYI